MRHFFQAEQWLPHPLEQVFAFFANPENLPRLMPVWQKARIESRSFVAPPSNPSDTYPPTDVSIAAGTGTRMTITFRLVPLLPFRVRWDAAITEFDWNDHFCDSQLRGPFAYWHHCHRLLRETREGVPGTLLKDEVNYQLPFGILGELAQRVAVKRQFEAMFAYRHRQTAELLTHTTPTP